MNFKSSLIPLILLLLFVIPDAGHRIRPLKGSTGELNIFPKAIMKRPLKSGPVCILPVTGQPPWITILAMHISNLVIFRDPYSSMKGPASGNRPMRTSDTISA